MTQSQPKDKPKSRHHEKETQTDTPSENILKVKYSKALS